jgi:hypothetical protein
MQDIAINEKEAKALIEHAQEKIQLCEAAGIKVSNKQDFYLEK